MTNIINNYRKDIDGLRAVSVLAVIFYHFFPKIATGGYTGVTIFFVISGYLITYSLLNDFNKNNSLYEFYIRRARRLFPSLIIILASNLIVGYTCLLSEEYKYLGKYIFGGSLFINNFIGLFDLGYFDINIQQKPLIHLWSLGIEEQFYIIWPITLYIILARTKSALMCTCILFGLSFCFNIYQSYFYASVNFYLPYSRFWELLSGSILAQYHFNKNTFFVKCKFIYIFKNSITNNLPSLLGLGLLFYIFANWSDGIRYPGYYALIPVLSTLLIIGNKNNDTWINKYLLSSRLMILIGLVSYPLYLWHWSVLSFYKIIFGNFLEFEYSLILIIITFFLAFITYYFIELPLRFGKNSTIILYGLFSSLVICCLLGIYIFISDGIQSRQFVKNNPKLDSGNSSYNELISDIDPSLPLRHYCGEEYGYDFFSICVIDKREKPIYALLGDSKMQSLAGALVKTSAPSHRWMLIGGTGPNEPPIPIISSDLIYSRFQLYANAALDKITANPEIESVLIAMSVKNIFQIIEHNTLENLPNTPNYDKALIGLKTGIEFLIKSNKTVYFLKDNPFLPDPRECIERKISILNYSFQINNSTLNCNLLLSTHLRLTEKYEKLLSELTDYFGNKFIVIDNIENYCYLDSGVCPILMNGNYLYSYTNHISEFSALKLSKIINDKLMADSKLKLNDLK